MECEVEYTDEFGEWWNTLTDDAQDSVEAVVQLLQKYGVKLGFPQSSKLKGTVKHHHLRELRIQHNQEPYRVIYAFDPRRMSILLLGGSKRGDKRWYDVHIPLAEDLYDVHLQELRDEEFI